MWAVRKRGPAPGLALEEVSVPAPADDEVLVEVEAASVCSPATAANGAPNEALIATPVGAVEADGNLSRLERWAHR